MLKAVAARSFRRLCKAPHATARRLQQARQFAREFQEFDQLSTHSDRRFALDWKDRYPQLDDRTAETGYDQHYVLHTAWAARVLAHTQPRLHVDISSNLYFNVACSAFVPIDFYDYRPAKLELDNLKSAAADLTDLHFADASVASLSCMHVAEHIGLGRYGDPLDPDGDLKAMRELSRVLAPGGDLLFVVPVGKPRIQFNAHRIYSYEQVRGQFANLRLQEFALIPDGAPGRIKRGASSGDANSQTYGCGCFWFCRR